MASLHMSVSFQSTDSTSILLGAGRAGPSVANRTARSLPSSVKRIRVESPYRSRCLGRQLPDLADAGHRACRWRGNGVLWGVLGQAEAPNFLGVERGQPASAPN